MTNKEETKETIEMYKGKQVTRLSETELKIEILQCLQVENLNFLIGAGCSSFCDERGQEQAIPTMVGLAKKFYEEYPDFKVNGKKAVELFPKNLEALITYLYSLNNIAMNSKKKTELKNKIKIINEFIFNEICTSDICYQLLNLYKEFYLRIVKKTRQVPINIYTTNYDLYNETALDELGFMYNNGFLGSTRRIFNPNSYNYIAVENLGLSRDVWKSVCNFFNLYKIHGSINWIIDDDSDTDISHILEKDIDIIRKREKFDSLMIYPTPQKDRTTLMVPYSDLFRMMQNNLLKKNSILITLGYSFGDEHINRILLNALSVYDFRLVIFGDSPMIDKLREIGDKRIWIINSKDRIHYFKNFVEKVLPIQGDEEQEKIEMKKSIKKLIAVLGENITGE